MVVVWSVAVAVRDGACGASVARRRLERAERVGFVACAVNCVLMWAVAARVVPPRASATSCR